MRAEFMLAFLDQAGVNSVLPKQSQMPVRVLGT